MSEKTESKADPKADPKTVHIQSTLNYPLTVSRQLREDNGQLKSGKRTISIVPVNIQINDLPAGVTPIPADVWREVLDMPQIASKLKSGSLKVIAK